MITFSLTSILFTKDLPQTTDFKYYGTIFFCISGHFLSDLHRSEFFFAIDTRRVETSLTRAL
jgi:hypothetical protein